jgi:methionyl-tRNA formyltransferase
MSTAGGLRVLLLSPYPDPGLDGTLRACGDRVVQLAGTLAGSGLDPADFDWTLCHGHEEPLPAETLVRARGRIAGLHLGLLPAVRGAQPLLWSLAEGVPGGVSLHYLDSGITTGDLIAQREAVLSDAETLEAAQGRLRRAAEALFAAIWPELRRDRARRWVQPEGVAPRTARDLDALRRLMPQGWQTTVGEMRRLAQAGRGASLVAAA